MLRQMKHRNTHPPTSVKLYVKPSVSIPITSPPILNLDSNVRFLDLRAPHPHPSLHHITTLQSQKFRLTAIELTP